MKFVLVIGSTETARIEGISAAGASAALMAHTPAVDAELVAYGHPIHAPIVPMSPSGCPTPAIVTRAVHESIGFDLHIIDAGLVIPTAAPSTIVGQRPGGDIREPEPVPNARAIFAEAYQIGAACADTTILIGESIPGGTTTALGTLRALGEPFVVSSSLSVNPVAKKQAVVAEGLTASGLGPGSAAEEPITALQTMGDPVLVAITGLVIGASENGSTVILGGGTQMIAAAAACRHAGYSGPLALASTCYVANDQSADFREAANVFDLDLSVTDPEFDRSGHSGLTAYAEGEAKEGVGMGGALWAAAGNGISMGTIRQRVIRHYTRLKTHGS